MKTLLPLLFSAALFTTARASQTVYLGATVDDNHEIVSMLITVGATDYEVSFDGAFGDRIFLGNKNGAIEARNAIALAFNTIYSQDPNYYHPRDDDPTTPFPFSFAVVSNELPFANVGNRFEITYGDNAGNREFVFAEYNAGWVSSAPTTSSGPSALYQEATFRVVPEASTGFLIGTAVLGSLIPRRR